MKDRDVRRLKEELQKKFKAEVEVEKISKGRFRLSVVSPMFKRMGQMTRQDRVWELVDEVLSRDATLDVSLILTFAPNELEEKSPIPG